MKLFKKFQWADPRLIQITDPEILGNCHDGSYAGEPDPTVVQGCSPGADASSCGNGAIAHSAHNCNSGTVVV